MYSRRNCYIPFCENEVNEITKITEVEEQCKAQAYTIATFSTLLY